MLSPVSVVAPVTANVILVAGVYDPSQQLVPFERVDWTVTPGGAGQITGLGEAPRGVTQNLFSQPPRGIDSNHAIGETFGSNIVLTRGTPSPADNITVLRGQTWLSVGSPVEGTGYVTAVAPNAANPNARQQSAVIHWVDARWTAPPPATVAAGGRHTLTTTIVRQSTNAPIAGWRVRYEVAGGPAAGFSPDGARFIELSTDAQGQASAEIIQQHPEAGTSAVAVQLNRPAATGVEALTIGSSKIAITWSAAPGALHITGPASASVGATATYRIDVTNPGPQPATHVAVTDTLPPGLTLLQSTPPADAGAALGWTLGDLRPGETRTIQLDARPEQGGSFNQCVHLQAAEGLTGQDCVTTVVQAAAAPSTGAPAGTIDVRLTGPGQAAVGSEVHFDLEITNRGAFAASGLVVVDRFDDGLIHAAAVSPIQRELDPVAPGETRKIGITFKVAKPGRLCQTVELTGAGGLRQTTSACVQADAGGQPAMPPGGVGPAVPGSGKPALTLKISGPPSTKVGATVQFVIEIRNTGDAPIPTVRVSDTCDAQTLRPVAADAGYTQAGAQFVWTIQNLTPGKVEYRRLNCVCLDAANRACDQVTVTDGGDLTLHDEACVQIQPGDAPAAGGGTGGSAGSGKLKVQISSRANPLKAGSDSSYQVTITNNGPNSERKLALAVTIPDLEQLVEGQNQNPAKAVIDGQTIRFDPIAEVKPGETLTFDVSVHASRAGDATAHAEVTSQAITTPTTADTPIHIFAE
jgi:uncharacterized repeat protein (TIGR01451 family)